MNTPEHQPRQQWTIFVDNATTDLGTETIAAALLYFASGINSTHHPRVQIIAEDVRDLAYVDGVGWVCPPCWAGSDGTDPGTVNYVETGGEARHVDLRESTETRLYVHGASTEGWDHNGLDPRLWCRSCLTRYALPDGVELDWN